MIKRATNNWGWKLLSLLLGFLLWLTVINIEDPQVSTTIRGIPVEKQNESAITSQKQAIQYVLGDTVDVKVKGKRSLVYKLTQSNIKAFADLRNLSITNAVDIQLELPNDIELISKSPSSVQVSLEKIISKQFEIEYEKQGKTKAGFIDLSPIISPATVKLEAAESLIYKIERVVAPVNIDGISGDFTISVIPVIYDYFGTEVSDISMSVQQIQIKVPVEKTKTLPILFQPQGKVGEEYEYLGAVLSESNVMVRGKQELIDKLQELVINTVDVSAMTGKQMITVNLAKLLPDEISLNQDKSTVEVQINIEPYVTREFSFRPEEVRIDDLPENKEILILGEELIKVSYRGIESKVNAITKDDIQPFISVGEKNNGIHSLPIEWQAPEGVEKISERTQLSVEISGKEAGGDINEER